MRVGSDAIGEIGAGVGGRAGRFARLDRGTAQTARAFVRYSVQIQYRFCGGGRK